MFKASTSVKLGDMQQALFWVNKWLDGASVAQFTLALTLVVDKRRRDRRLVKDAIDSGHWIGDITGLLSM
jgi:hypothetical protein